MKRLAVLVALAALVTGALTRAQSPDIHYVPTPPEVVDAMLKVANVTSADVVFDLGSGDGRIVIEAARKYGARGVGIELDAALIKQATRNAERAGVAEKVMFRQADFFKVDLSEATVVTLYLTRSINQRLQPKLLSELRPGSRVVSHRFDMPLWTPDQDIVVRSTHVYLWTIGRR
jgi:precorrin-6B methylase 2